MRVKKDRARTLALLLVLMMASTACGKGKPAADGNVESGSPSGSADNIETVNSGEEIGSDGNTASGDASTSIPSSQPLNIIDDKYRTTYEIFVYSFYDSDGDGIGDLKGVTEKLDYVNDGDDTTDTDLGCNEIWLMPISPSPTYHKYDITDYKEIDPQYGTLEDFDELLSKCHERGVNLIIDLVLNHTSSEHPWFKEAARYLKDHQEIASLYYDSDPMPELEKECPYLYYYNFSREKQAGYEKLGGTEWYYEARFWSGMPDLNLDSDKVKEEIAGITQFWIDRGVDGFRLDAVTSYYTENDPKNIEFMTWLNDTIKSQKADAYIVGEAWTSIATYSKYYQSGIDSFFDFNFSGSEGAIASVARGKKSPLALINAWSDAEKDYSKNNENYIDAPFYTNHDMARSAGYFVGRGSQNMVKMAGALNLLMGGNAFVYYGEELGMKGSGKDENKRAPMQWTSDASATGMCKGPSGMEDIKMSYPALDEQMKDETSIYNYYKKAIKLRNMYPVIARGLTEPVEELSEDSSKGVGAFVRYMKNMAEPVLGGESDPVYGETALLILINNSDEAKTVDLSKWGGTGSNPELAYEINVGEETSSLDGANLVIPSYGIAVIK